MQPHAREVLKEAGYGFSIRADARVGVDQAIGDGDETLVAVYAVDEDIYVEKAYVIIEATAIGGADGGSDRWQVDLQNIGPAGAGTTSLLSGGAWTSEDALAIETPDDLGVDQNRLVPAGSQLGVVITEDGTPNQDLIGAVHIVYWRRV